MPAAMRCAIGTLVFLTGSALPAAAAPLPFAVESQAVTQLDLKQSFDFITKPILVSPAANALLPDGLITLQWEASTDPRGWPLTYGVAIRQGGVNVATFQTAETRITLEEGDALPPGVYSWGVVAYNAGGAGHSDEVSFTIAGEVAVDGGIPDAGTASDAGSIEADAGSRDSGVPVFHEPLPHSLPPSESSGCSSSPAGGAFPGALLPLLALGLMLRATHRHRGTHARLPSPARPPR
ncbi:MYXO-CTERM sorting domain-containing protein [Corallococcus exiguus]|uniref:Fibronectin type III domain-containing protein n=1 Tax=Corallococcus exiguus TaxID=83462 RepID=A0A7X4YBM7_9BACT|nr:MYXO-CTERM sorting domain-containing protein [Corallococcus exiguus]NBC42251.1 hypothetical protein [Corallococcus exiguus]TNV53182.1 hypothetical protein FH620_36430 [Corallococcus exiguus]